MNNDIENKYLELNNYKNQRVNEYNELKQNADAYLKQLNNNLKDLVNKEKEAEIIHSKRVS